MIHSLQIKRLLNLKSAWLLLTAMLFAPCANAVDYDVEVIIFEHVRKTTIGASNTLLFPVVPNAEQIPQTPTPGAAIQPIGELRLLEEAEKIKTSNNHRLLYHGGWRQGAIDRENAPFVSVALGSGFNLLAERYVEPTFTEEDSDKEEYVYLRGYATPPADSQGQLQQQRSTRLFGGVKVWVGRFLHFDTLLSYTPRGADYSFAFQSERRMRSRRMHYIDHPRVGIITKIFPVDETAPN